MTDRIVVVTAARALSRTVAARWWAIGELVVHLRDAGTVAHGACPVGGDSYADTLAQMAGIVIVRFPAVGVPMVLRYAQGAIALQRTLRDGDRYASSAPLERNANMARWAGDLLAEGVDVRGLSLRCPWPMRPGTRATQGTAHCRDRLVAALGADRVEDLECPSEYGPTEA